MRRGGWMKCFLQREVYSTNKREKEEICIPPGTSDSWAFTAMMTQSLTSCKFMEIYSIVRFCYRSHFASFHQEQFEKMRNETRNQIEKIWRKLFAFTIASIQNESCLFFHLKALSLALAAEFFSIFDLNSILFQLLEMSSCHLYQWKKSEKEAELQLVARRRGDRWN